MNTKKVSKIKFNKRQIWQVAFTAMTASALMAVDERATIRLIQEETQEAMGRFRQETNEQMSTKIRKINEINSIDVKLRIIRFDLARLEMNNNRFEKEHNRVFDKVLQETRTHLLQAIDLSREESDKERERLDLMWERYHAMLREHHQSYLAERRRLREEQIRLEEEQIRLEEELQRLRAIFLDFS